MKIDDQKWNEIIAATQAGIEACKGRATKYGVAEANIFRCEGILGPTHTVLMTEHRDCGYLMGRKAIARELASGEVRAAKAKVIGKGKIGFAVKTPDPKAWRSLADKPANEIVHKLKLTDFIIIHGAQATVSS